MPTLIQNICGNPVSLPFPYRGMLPAGRGIIVADTPAQIIANLGGASKVNGVLVLTTVTTSPDTVFPGIVSAAYDIGAGMLGRPDGAAVLLRFPAPRAFTLPAGLALSQAVVGTAPAASAAFSLQKNGVQFGTITFAIGATVGVFAAAADAVFVAGNILTIVAPNPQDLLLADVGIVLAATRTLS